MPNKLASSASNLLDDETAADSFSLALLAGGRKEKTEKTYLAALNYLSRFADEKGMPPIAALSTEHLREYFRSMYDRNLRGSSISVQYRALQQFYRWLVNEGERLDNPLERVPPPRVEERIQAHYEPGDIERVLKRLPAASRDWRILRNRAIVLTLYDTGLRGNELCGLRSGDLDLRDLSLTVTHGPLRPQGGARPRPLLAGPPGAQGRGGAPPVARPLRPHDR